MGVADLERGGEVGFLCTVWVWTGWSGTYQGFKHSFCGALLDILTESLPLLFVSLGIMGALSPCLLLYLYEFDFSACLRA